jgi:hypothetical protein
MRIFKDLLGSRHHLHGLCDLLDVLDRLQAHGNGLQSGHSTVLLTEAYLGRQQWDNWLEHFADACKEHTIGD